MISGLYFNAMPEHKKPRRAQSEASRNRGIKGSMRDTSGVYAKAEEAAHYFKRKVLPKIEAARKRGEVVRFVNGRWFINGKQLEA
ncbi:hypothetical protein X534_gp04 [Ralstonia phage RSB3]|uniref:Uncharacterized protein n=1 Tax=Ralstonia phage RSB3 TaxID=1402875 RepID=U3TJX9_9CAUD|nr:hypothetical protein X534_gp04 [Ralstonia phage RSB3]BAN92315.1 hypothetical protein [Ralstonia phage RSB3]